MSRLTHYTVERESYFNKTTWDQRKGYCGECSTSVFGTVTVTREKGRVQCDKCLKKMKSAGII